MQAKQVTLLKEYYFPNVKFIQDIDSNEFNDNVTNGWKRGNYDNIQR